MWDHVVLYLNGKRFAVRGDDAFLPLVEFLRDRPGLRGTKVGCAEGDCGACTVLVGVPEAGSIRYRPAVSCIRPLHQLDGAHVVTIEGLTPPDGLSAVQQAMVEHHGSQCGYCTPGYVAAMEGLLESGTAPDDAALRTALASNLCRCTGYLPILEAGLAVDGEASRRLSSLCPSREMHDELGARGFYAAPGVDFNRETNRGNPFLYYTQGAAVSEVEIDRLTGELSVLRVDVLIDIGRPLNPAIDRGQVIGGFVQGMGWPTTEELLYSETGELLSHSPNNDKVPNVECIPRDVRVAFLENAGGPLNLLGSKAVGEPPFVLGLSVWAAAKQAVTGVLGTSDRSPALNLPATSEEILRRIPRLDDAGPERHERDRDSRVGRPDGTTKNTKSTKNSIEC